MNKYLIIVLGSALLGGGTVLWIVNQRAARQAEEYRQQLQESRRAFEDLRAQFNEAVARTAVTELWVREGKLSVRIRTMAGVVKTIDTPFDPTGEIYVDYVILDSRLWIRRVFDEHTPPAQALVIDPLLAKVDWESPRLQVGKAVYRKVSTGCWVVTVTGDGSLGLRRVEDGEEVKVSAPPQVRDYEPIGTGK